MTSPAPAPRWRTALLLALAAVPVAGFLAVVAWGFVEGQLDERRWDDLNDEATTAYEAVTDQEVLAASLAADPGLGGTGAWPLPTPEGLTVMGVQTAPDTEVVLATTDLVDERCLRLSFDAEGLTGHEEISCRTYRLTGGADG